MRDNQILPVCESADSFFRSRSNSFYLVVMVGVIAIAMLLPGISVGQESQSTNGPDMKGTDPAPGPTAYTGPGPQPKIGVSEKTATGETWGDHSYVIPFGEVVIFEALLNLYDRTFLDKYNYGTSWESFKRNIQTAPQLDSDSFQINQLGHPYQGSMYFGFGRSAGLSYWQSLMYSIGGSELWETAGETTPPSLNDHIASGIGGSFLGEPLFRMASLLLESGGEKPGFWRELGATVISPPTGINRLLFGRRFDKIFPSHDPATFMWLRLGVGLTTRELDNAPSSKTYDRLQATIDFMMEYGLPGQFGYTYDRPFDYFKFEFAFGTGKPAIESIMTRGLLYGTGYELGDNYRGLWGLYGSYDYISPQIFRVSSTAVSLGTTAQWWLRPHLALQYSFLGGLGYAAAGNISGPGERNYRYGITPQGLQAVRLILWDRAMLDMNLREYFVTDWGGNAPAGSEFIRRGTVGLSVRLFGRHALGLQLTDTSRDSQLTGFGDRHQTEEIVSVVYTLLGSRHLSAVEE